MIAAIGFAGSYAAVRDLAEKKGFGAFARLPHRDRRRDRVLLALDLLLTWIRIPFPLLRQTAWLLTAATIAFNGAAAWPDPLGVGMHARHPGALRGHRRGRPARDRPHRRHHRRPAHGGRPHLRWLLPPVPTFRLWRRMKLWELRSYDEVIRWNRTGSSTRPGYSARYGRLAAQGPRGGADAATAGPLRGAVVGDRPLRPRSGRHRGARHAGGGQAAGTRRQGTGERPAALTAGEPPRDAETAAAPSQPPQAPPPARFSPPVPSRLRQGPDTSSTPTSSRPSPRHPRPRPPSPSPSPPGHRSSTRRRSRGRFAVARIHLRRGDARPPGHRPRGARPPPRTGQLQRPRQRRARLSAAPTHRGAAAVRRARRGRGLHEQLLFLGALGRQKGVPAVDGALALPRARRRPSAPRGR